LVFFFAMMAYLCLSGVVVCRGSGVTVCRLSWLPALSVSESSPSASGVSVNMKDVVVRGHVIRMEAWKGSTKNFSEACRAAN
jgi:hypothetical protein